jgi:hypothetical protein
VNGGPAMESENFETLGIPGSESFRATDESRNLGECISLAMFSEVVPARGTRQGD